MIALLAAMCMLGPVADPKCTPGAYVPLTRAQACVTKRRPTLSDYDRNLILVSYGVPRWTGKDGELDHVQPFYAGGVTDPRNIFPQPKAAAADKDRLEDYTRRRACHRLPDRTLAPTMTLSTVHRIFKRDWRVAFRRYAKRGWPQ